MMCARLGLLATIALVGCGPASQRVGLEGLVSFDGEPLASGTVIFVPQSDTRGPSTGSAIVDGKYRVDPEKGLLPGGHYRVEIRSLRNSGKKIPSAMRGPSPTYELAENFIPANYNTHSELTVVVEQSPDVQQVDFQLRSKRVGNAHETADSGNRS